MEEEEKLPKCTKCKLPLEYKQDFDQWKCGRNPLISYCQKTATFLAALILLALFSHCALTKHLAINLPVLQRDQQAWLELWITQEEGTEDKTDRCDKSMIIKGITQWELDFWTWKSNVTLNYSQAWSF